MLAITIGYNMRASDGEERKREKKIKIIKATVWGLSKQFAPQDPYTFRQGLRNFQLYPSRS